MKSLYLFSGLGADTRLFQNFGPIDGLEIVPLPWIHPGDSKTLGDYADLLMETYDFKTPCWVGGVSMGGMIAQELAARIKPEGQVLISTARSIKEMPLLFEWTKKIRLENFMHKPFLEVVAKIGDPFTIKSKEGRALFRQMLKDADPDLMKFGAQAILNWQPSDNNTKTIRIHGTNDRVFPIKKVGETIKILDGNHFMVFEKGAEITQELNERIKKLSD